MLAVLVVVAGTSCRAAILSLTMPTGILPSHVLGRGGWVGSAAGARVTGPCFRQGRYRPRGHVHFTYLGVDLAEHWA
jgi:hypothetical protein